jgi:hypothetical protein
LNRTHLISLAVNGLFVLLRVLIFRSSFSRGTLLKFIVFAAPAGVIELFFERNSRPKYAGNELKSGGEDLEAKGLTEWMWDLLYWTWITTALVALFGDRLWWAMVGHATQAGRGKKEANVPGKDRRAFLFSMASIYYFWKCEEEPGYGRTCCTCRRECTSCNEQETAEAGEAWWSENGVLMNTCCMAPSTCSGDMFCTFIMTSCTSLSASTVVYWSQLFLN